MGDWEMRDLPPGYWETIDEETGMTYMELNHQRAMNMTDMTGWTEEERRRVNAYEHHRWTEDEPYGYIADEDSARYAAYQNNFYTPDEALAKAWEMAQKHPGQLQAYLSKLDDTYGITADQYSEYDSTIVANKEVMIMEDRIRERDDLLKDIPGFSQSMEMSDAEIIRTFDSLYELEEQKKNAKRVPTESEWFIAGEAAQKRIDELEPAYKVKKEEEWKLLTKGNVFSPPEGMEDEMFLPWLSEAAGGVLTGLTGFTHEMLFGWMDFTQNKRDIVAHEREDWTLNPFTGFGTWDIAEMRPNPETGGWGFSEDILALEADLEELYSVKTHYNEQMTQGGYQDKYALDKKYKELSTTLPEGVVDPRLYGEME